MTATQSDDERTLTRRGVMRTTAVGIGSAAALGMSGSASAITKDQALFAFSPGAYAVGYLIQKGIDVFTGSEKDYPGYTGIDALRKGVYEDALDAESTDERVMTSIENNLQNSKNVGLSKGKAALVEALNNGATESEANTAMNEAINEYYSTIQENILTHYGAQVNKLASMANSLGNHSNFTSPSSFYFVWNNGGYVGIRANNNGTVFASKSTNNVSLLNGDSKSVPEYTINVADGNFVGLNWKPGATDSNGDPVDLFQWQKPDGSSSTTYGLRRIVSAFENAVTTRDEVNSQLVGFASDLYSNYGAGDIPSDEVLDPITAATELGNNTGLSLREAQAGMMGIPTSAGFSLRLELADDDGNTYEVDAEIYTNAQPNDTDGNPAGFKIGNTYDPAKFQAPIFVSYEYVDPETGEETTDFTQVENLFTVLEATDSEGNEVEEVTPTSQTAQTADISSIEEELASIREEQQRLLEKSQDPAGGAGAGYFSGSGPSTGLIAAVVGVIGVLYALTQGGMN